MPQLCLTSSRRGDMQALAVHGIFATDCYPQIHGLIRRDLGPDCAALLAEPQHDAAQQRIDWYTSREGKAVPVSELPPEQAQALRAKAARHAAAIAALGQRHDAADGDMAGDMASLAVRHVGEDDLWSVGGEPVLVNWGFAPGRAGAQAQDLSRMGHAPQAPAPLPVAVPPVAPPVAPPVTPGGRGCLWWLLPLPLLLLLLWLLLAALGYLPSPLPAGCAPTPDTAALDKEKARTAPLENELEALLRQLRERAALCVPPAPEPVEKAAPKTVEPFFGESPPEEVKPEPKPAPKPKPAPAPKPKVQARKGDKMAIPKDAAQQKDLSFLEGCWASDTGLRAVPSGKPVIVEYCFDRHGNGRRFEHVEGQESCSGPGTARFQGNRLHMESPYAQCPDGSRFVPHSIDCTGSGNSTLCKGREHDNKGTRWTARFRKQ